MDITNFPKGLIFKERTNLNEFGTNVEGSLNSQIYKILRIHFRSRSLEEYTRLLLWILNESYYLTTIILLDKHAIEKLNEYSNSIYLDSLYTVKDTNNYKEIIYSLVCVFLTVPAQKSTYLSNVRRFIRWEASELIAIDKVFKDSPKPNRKEFAPVPLTKDLLSRYDWEKMTFGYDLEEIKDYISCLGSDKSEKRLLIKTIFQSYYSSGKMYGISSRVDSFLMDKYLQLGGTKEDLTNEESNKSVDGLDDKKDKRIQSLEKEKEAQQEIIKN